MDSHSRADRRPASLPILLRGGRRRRQLGRTGRRAAAAPAGRSSCPWPRNRPGGGGREAAADLWLPRALSSFLRSVTLPGFCSPGTSSSSQTCPGTPGPAPGMRRPGPADWRDCADERVQALLVSAGGPPLQPGPRSASRTFLGAPLTGLGLGRDGSHTPQRWFPCGSASLPAPSRVPRRSGCGEDQPAA